jgi:hypothetical protein
MSLHILLFSGILPRFTVLERGWKERLEGILSSERRIRARRG